jgi:hypothetical protein
LTQVKQKQELDLHSLRDEALRKDKNTARIKAQRFAHTLEQKVDQARINKVVEGFSSCHSTDEAVKFVKEWLVGKNQDKTSPQELERKIQELDQREEKFNQHVAVIPESDEVAIQLTAEI